MTCRCQPGIQHCGAQMPRKWKFHCKAEAKRMRKLTRQAAAAVTIPHPLPTSRNLEATTGNNSICQYICVDLANVPVLQLKTSEVPVLAAQHRAVHWEQQTNTSLGKMLTHGSANEHAGQAGHQRPLGQLGVLSTATESVGRSLAEPPCGQPSQSHNHKGNGTSFGTSTTTKGKLTNTPKTGKAPKTTYKNSQLPQKQQFDMLGPVKHAPENNIIHFTPFPDPHLTQSLQPGSVGFPPSPHLSPGCISSASRHVACICGAEMLNSISSTRIGASRYASSE